MEPDMDIGLIGYGKMGKSVQKAATELGHTIQAIIAPGNENATSELLEKKRPVDVYIDFSTASQVHHSIDFCIEAKIPLIIGTTGWELSQEKLKKIENASSAVLFAPNFSLGVNLFMTLAKTASMLIKNLDDFDIALREVHHREKIDSPSGTAINLAKSIIKDSLSKENLSTAQDRQIAKDELHLSSTRVGSVIGIHDLLISSPSDLIEIKHTSMGRSSYAQGALLAASWILGKQGYFTFQDLLKEKFNA